jgi:hypothetical protein
MKESALVLYASNWTLDDGATGCTLHVLASGVTRANARGNPVAKVSGPALLFNKLQSVPGVYEMSYDTAVRDGRLGLSLRDVEFSEAVDLPDVGSFSLDGE